MVEQLITEHLDLWTSAHTTRSTSGRGSSNKLELSGIKKLRELILGLAVRGKLVSQDINDDPAQTILERLDQHKAQLINEGKVKKTKVLPSAVASELDYNLPGGWVCFRVGNYLDFQYGKALSAKARDDSGKFEVFGSNGVVGTHSEYLEAQPSIVIGRKGSAGALNKALNPSWTTDVAYFVVPPVGFDFDYTFLLLKALRLESLGKGIKPGVNRNEAYALAAALPPYGEQRRIVAKFDELMDLCDQLERQTEASISAHQTLVETLLATLTDSLDADELAQNWARLAEHFDTLFTTEHSIEQLKQTILQLAVRGKLVQQNPNTTPGEFFASNLKAEKHRQIEARVRKKQKPLPEISLNDLPFKLPSGWSAIRMGDSLEVINGRAYKKHEMLQEGTPLLRVGNLFTSNEWYYSDLDLEPNKYIDNGDLIYAWSASFGPFIWNGGEAIYHYHIWKMDIFDTASLSKDFAYYYLLAITGEIKASGSGIAMVHMTKDKMEKIVIPIPPYEEQLRIVEKIESLYEICSELLDITVRAKQVQGELAKTIVEQAVA